MGLYTKINEQIDNYYEVVSINKSLSKKLLCLKFIVFLLLIFIVYMVIECFFNLFKILSQLSLLHILFKSNLFISSTKFESAIPILSSKNCIWLSFCSNSMSRSDIVSPLRFIACLKTLI